MASQDITPPSATKLEPSALINSEDIIPLLQLQQDVASAVAQKTIKSSAVDQISEVLSIVQSGLTTDLTAAQVSKIEAVLGRSDIPTSITKNLRSIAFADEITAADSQTRIMSDTSSTPSNANKLVSSISSTPSDASKATNDETDTPSNANKLDSNISGTPPIQRRFNGPKDQVGLINAAINYAIKYFSQLKSGILASVESLNPLRIQPAVITGARAVLRINGLVVGYANNISYSYDTEWTEISGIDSEIPDELVPGVIRVTGTISIFRRPNNSASQLFWQSDVLRMRVWPYSVIEVRDKKTDNLLAKFPKVAFTKRSETIAHGQLVMTQLSFVSIGFRDELTPQPPDVESEQGGLVGQGKKIVNAAKSVASTVDSFFS